MNSMMKNGTNRVGKKEKDCKLFKNRISEMSLEDIANSYILICINKYRSYTFPSIRNIGDHFDDIHYMIKNIDSTKKDEIIKFLAKVKNLPSIINDIIINFDTKEIKIINVRLVR